MADIIDSSQSSSNDPAQPVPRDPSLTAYVDDLVKNDPVLEKVADTVSEEQLIVPNEPPPPPADKPKKTGASKGVIVGLVAMFFLVTTSLVFVFVNQQSALNDIRNRAEDLYVGSDCDIRDNPCPEGYECHCRDGNTCSIQQCELTETTKKWCDAQDDREWCVNQGGGAWTCCESGYFCGASDGCYPVGGGGTPKPTNPPGGSTPTPTTPPGSTNTPTPTPIVAQCDDIKIYKNGIVVVPSTLRSSDAVVIAVTGGNATKARIRVNGSAWTETTTKNASGEYTLNYTIPSGVTNFTIESEIFGLDGVWH